MLLQLLLWSMNMTVSAFSLEKLAMAVERQNGSSLQGKLQQLVLLFLPRFLLTHVLSQVVSPAAESFEFCGNTFWHSHTRLLTKGSTEHLDICVSQERRLTQS